MSRSLRPGFDNECPRVRNGLTLEKSSNQLDGFGQLLLSFIVTGPQTDGRVLVQCLALPTPKTLPGAKQLSVAIACATIVG